MKELEKNPMTIELAVCNLYGNSHMVKERILIEHDRDYTRVSEYVTVEFTPRDREEIVKDELARLDEKETDKRAEMQAALDRIEDERRSLLAITHQPTEVPDETA